MTLASVATQHHHQSLAGQQQQEDNESKKAQKGWLTRWTRRQWSRHWFVLKNGCLTYYRGPAAELCSFLDGVLDLSLIKQIEVPEVSGDSAALGPAGVGPNGQHLSASTTTTSYHHFLSSNQTTSIQSQSQQQQQVRTAAAAANSFNFTLKMWNGECHTLGASSAAERQLWLSAINTSANGDFLDDGETSTDSAASSCSSSSKSVDIGHQRPTLGAAKERQAHGSLDKATELSLEQLAARLKSAVRRRRSELESSIEVVKLATSATAGVVPASESADVNGRTGVANHETVACSEQRRQTAEALSSRVRGETQARREEEEEKEERQAQPSNNNNRPSQQEETKQLQVKESSQHQMQQPRQQQQQAASLKQEEREHCLKRRLMCAPSIGASHSFEGHASATTRLLVARNSIAAQPLRLCGAASSSSSEDEDYEMSDGDEGAAAEESRVEEEEAGGKGEEGRGGANGGAKPKKRVTFDLSSVSLAGISPLSRPISSSASSSASSDGDEDAEEAPADEQQEQAADEPLSESSSTSSSAESELSSGSTISSASESEGEQETEVNGSLGSARQAPPRSARPLATPGGDESTCELVRQMINRRRLRLAQSMVTSVSREMGSAPNHEQQPEMMDTTTSLTSPTPSDDGEAERQRQQQQQQQLEENVRELERRLNDSYAQYKQLEISYKQLQCDLVASDELRASDSVKLQLRIEQLERQLEASERALAEAHDKWMLQCRAAALEAARRKCCEERRRRRHERALLIWLQRRQNYHSLAAVLLEDEQQLKQQQQRRQQQQRVNEAKDEATSGLSQAANEQQVATLGELLALKQQQQRHQRHNQALGARLLAQNKQVQRRLEELVAKVDEIHQSSCLASTTTTTTTASN